MEAAKQEAEQANIAKSRFLAAASHDLRQPLQTLTLLQGLLGARCRRRQRRRKLVARLDETLGAMTGMLNTLLDINQIEAGAVRAEMVSFPINDLLDRLRDEFTYHAQAQRLSLRVVPCGLYDLQRSAPARADDPQPAVQRAEIHRARQGAARLPPASRRRVSIEIWDTGIGIPDGELQAIFEEYHQLDNAARERTRGLGLGLSIVQRLAKLLGHRIHVRSRLGKGSVFSIEVMIAAKPEHCHSRPTTARRWLRRLQATRRATAKILIVEDDPEVRELARNGASRRRAISTATAPDGTRRSSWLSEGSYGPTLILADYNLPNGLNGLQIAAKCGTSSSAGSRSSS